MERIERVFHCALLSALLCATHASASDPLSAIDWLDNRTPQVVFPITPLAPVTIDEPPVAGSVTTPDVTVSAIGAVKRAAAGLLPTSVTGLPRDLWQNSETDVLSALIPALSLEGKPALQSLLYTLLLAEANEPSDARAADFMRVRVQKLLSLGALDPAAALLERADPAHKDLFDMYFDVALLSGDANGPCSALRADPKLSPEFAQRIFCDARAQNWDTAALTLTTADAIGALSALDAALLERFLDPDLFEDTPAPAPPARPNALQFRLFEAIGEPLPTAPLPRAFAAVDLMGDAGWKAQLDAAERLARLGAISENRLLGVYTSRIPSASGGIWDRAEAVQRLETAMKSGDPQAILRQTRKAWTQMQSVGLQVPFATLYAEPLLRIPSTGADADLVTEIVLLSPLYESAATRKTQNNRLSAAQGIAKGSPHPAPTLALMAPISEAFGNSDAPQSLTQMARSGKLGEAILRAMALTASGADGDPAALQSGLTFLRSVGLEDTSRRVALQLLLIGDAES